jgi:hypothetical protein
VIRCSRIKRYSHFLFIAAMAIPLSGCLSTCENEVASEVASPSGKLKAVLFERGCGATTGFNTQLSIIDAADDVPDAGGNAIVLDGRIPLQINWLSDGELTISGWKTAQIFKQEKLVNGVRLQYTE